MNEDTAIRVTTRMARNLARVSGGNTSETAAWMSGMELGMALAKHHPHEADLYAEATAIAMPGKPAVEEVARDVAESIRRSADG